MKRRSAAMGSRESTRSLIATLALACALGGAPLLQSVTQASAQAIVTAVNGDPVTTFDLDEYVKILRLERKAASRADALEAVIADRLRFDEARHWGIDASDSDVSAALQRASASVKLDTSAFSEAAAKSKIDLETIRYHLRSAAAWDNMVRARNKGVGATEEEIAAAIAKGNADKVTSYRLQQVIFVLPASPSPATVESRTLEARALRNRFDGCANGLQLARSIPDVAVKEGMTRTSDALGAALRKVLAETPRGMLTPPERSVNGIEMVAVCEKDSGDSSTLHDQVQKNLVAEKLIAVSAKMYKDLRATAVVSKN